MVTLSDSSSVDDSVSTEMLDVLVARIKLSVSDDNVTFTDLSDNMEDSSAGVFDVIYSRRILVDKVYL
jgi:hypothetical protein